MSDYANTVQSIAEYLYDGVLGAKAAGALLFRIQEEPEMCTPTPIGYDKFDGTFGDRCADALLSDEKAAKFAEDIASLRRASARERKDTFGVD